MTEVYYDTDHIFMCKDYKYPIKHKHIAKHLIFGLDNKFECIVENTSFHCNGICINSNIEHTVISSKGELLVFLFYETSNLAEELSKKYLNGNSFQIIDKNLTSSIKQEWKVNYKDPVILNNHILSVCKLNQNLSLEYDPRICELLKIVHKLKGIYPNTIHIICDKLCLSQSRLSHLFKEQIGVSLNSYLLSEKMRKTYLYVIAGEKITTACVKAGFYSSSHFSSTCKKMFGLSFTNLFKKAIFKKIN